MGSATKAGGAIVVGLFLAHAAGTQPVSTTPPGSAAVQATGFAEAQKGKPYQWGGTGPAAFDCSGLVQQAWAAAGVTIPRTSQAQWAALPHVASPQPGDLVFFAGADGTTTAPGHVAMVTGPHKMVEAYATGYLIRDTTFGLPSSPQGDTNPVGYADPAAR